MFYKLFEKTGTNYFESDSYFVKLFINTLTMHPLLLSINNLLKRLNFKQLLTEIKQNRVQIIELMENSDYPIITKLVKSTIRTRETKYRFICFCIIINTCTDINKLINNDKLINLLIYSYVTASTRKSRGETIRMIRKHFL